MNASTPDRSLSSSSDAAVDGGHGGGHGGGGGGATSASSERPRSLSFSMSWSPRVIDRQHDGSIEDAMARIASVEATVTARSVRRSSTAGTSEGRDNFESPENRNSQPLSTTTPSSSCGRTTIATTPLGAASFDAGEDGDLDEEDINHPEDENINYMQSNTSQKLNMNHVMQDILEENNDTDCDSDDDAEDLVTLDEAYRERQREKMMVLYENTTEPAEEDVGGFMLKTGVAPNVKMATIPSNWKCPPVQQEKGEPEFNDVDNPGKWARYYYTPKFSSKGNKGKFVRYSLPTGAMPVPENESGDRIIDDWQFYYRGWEADLGGTARGGVTAENPFPKERQGHLNYELLIKMGLCKRRLKQCDAFFIMQLLFPVCDPAKSGIDDDPRLPYYSEVEKWSREYAVSIGVGGSYGHAFPDPLAEDYVHFDYVTVRDGVRGGSQGAIYRRWKVGDCDFDSFVANAMTHTRYLQCKRTYKLCSNGSAPKKGQDDYDPAYKYDYILKCLCWNVNAITAKAEDDLAADETTAAHQGPGESGCDLQKRRVNKPGVTKGMQTVIFTDVHRWRPRAYVHRHNLMDRMHFTQQGPAEIAQGMKKLLPLIDGTPQQYIKIGSGINKRRLAIPKIFKSKPHITADNYSSGDDIMEHVAKEGFGFTCTVARNRLPKNVDSKFFHKQSTQPGDPKAKAARFCYPIVAVKRIKTDGGYAEVVHTSFQSTSSCNISSVNGLNTCNLFTRVKQRGRKRDKREWVIEMNEARQLYLHTYGTIDTEDGQIRKQNMRIRCWKYWFAMKQHIFAFGVAVAYDIYKEIHERRALDALKFTAEERSCLKMKDFHEFRDLLSKQGLQYEPKNRLYPGDSKFRVNTILPKNKRTGNPRGRPKGTTKEEMMKRKAASKNHKITIQQYEARCKTRICTDLSQYAKHAKSIESLHSAKPCAYCGQKAYHRCTLCPGKPALHMLSKKVAPNSICHIRYHDEYCIGLGKMDFKTLFDAEDEWCLPTTNDYSNNKRYITNLKKKIQEEI